MDENTQEKLIAGHRLLADFLTNELGCKTSTSTVTKICSPAINEGPPVEGYWGRSPLFLPSRVRQWARSRMRPAQQPHAA
jgi:hypothetical protein